MKKLYSSISGPAPPSKRDTPFCYLNPGDEVADRQTFELHEKVLRARLPNALDGCAQFSRFGPF